MPRRNALHLVSFTLAATLTTPLAIGQGCSTEANPATHTRTGQSMPSIALRTTTGQPFSLKAQRGKIVFVNFWATWCGPCRAEMPRLESEIWQKHKDDPNFVMVAIAREQTDAEIRNFEEKAHYTFPLAADPKRSTYTLFADSGIPRSYLVDRDGTILAQTVGYCPDDFNHMESMLEQALQRRP